MAPISDIVPSSQRNTTYKSRFFSKINQTVYSIRTNEISCFLFEDNVTILVTNNNRNYIINYSLEALENLLDPCDFFRINRRCIIKIDSIKKMHLLSKSRIETILENGMKEMVSRSKNTAFRSWLDL